MCLQMAAAEAAAIAMPSDTTWQLLFRYVFTDGSSRGSSYCHAF
jgi:hypothetical protein